MTVWGLLSFSSGWVGKQLLCMEELVAALWWPVSELVVGRLVALLALLLNCWH